MDVQPDLGGFDPGSDRERSSMSGQRLQRVMATLDALPGRQREVFLLHRIDDLTYLQIARRTGVSINAVEKHIGLALREIARGI